MVVGRRVGIQNVTWDLLLLECKKKSSEDIDTSKHWLPLNYEIPRKLPLNPRQALWTFLKCEGGAHYAPLVF